MNTKKILTIILSTILILSLVGCGKGKSNVSENETKSVENLDEKSQTEENASKESQVNMKEIKTDKRTKVQGVSVIYPSNWVKKIIDGEDIYLLDNKGTNVNLVVESMNGYSEEVYNKASDRDVKVNLGVDNIKVQESVFNNKKARVTYYIQKHKNTNTATYQVTFLNNNMSYIFTIAGPEKISEENMKSFDSMLSTIEFEN